MAHIPRRDFLKKAAAAAAGFTIVPRFVLGGQGYIAPSDELTKAVIGVGGMGLGHIAYEGARLLAVCDVDANHLAQGMEAGGPGVKDYRDFREVLARPDIDIVHIATPPALARPHCGRSGRSRQGRLAVIRDTIPISRFSLSPMAIRKLVLCPHLRCGCPKGDRP